MKVRCIISVVLLFVYSVMTFVGIGIFRCGCTQSQQLVVMSVQTACPPCSSSTESCCPHSDQYQHEKDDDRENGCQENDCCLLEYQYMEVDQLLVAHFQDIRAKALSLVFFPVISVYYGMTTTFNECTVNVKNNSPPRDLLKVPLIYLHAQLRL